MRLTARVAEAQVDLAVAECHALTGVGCLQGASDGGVVALDMWMPAAQSPGPDALRAHLAASGIDAQVSEAEQDDAAEHADEHRRCEDPPVSGPEEGDAERDEGRRDQREDQHEVRTLECDRSPRDRLPRPRTTPAGGTGDARTGGLVAPAATRRGGRPRRHPRTAPDGR